MARKPSVFVRTLSMDEGRKIQRNTRTAKDPVRLRRAIVVMMSGQGQAVADVPTASTSTSSSPADRTQVVAPWNNESSSYVQPYCAGIAT